MSFLSKNGQGSFLDHPISKLVVAGLSIVSATVAGIAILGTLTTTGDVTIGATTTFDARPAIYLDAAPAVVTDGAPAGCIDGGEGPCWDAGAEIVLADAGSASVLIDAGTPQTIRTGTLSTGGGAITLAATGTATSANNGGIITGTGINAARESVTAGTLSALLTTVTDSAEVGAWVFSCVTGGAAPVECARLTSAGLTLAGVLYLPDGTAAAPALTFAADTNTGVYRLGADEFAMVANGSLRQSIKSSWGAKLYGNLIFSTDGASDIGASGASRPKDYFGVGSITIGGDIAVNGDDLTCDGDLTITPAGGDTTVTGTLTATGAIASGGVESWSPPDFAASPVAATLPMNLWAYNRTVADDGIITLPSITANGWCTIVTGVTPGSTISGSFFLGADGTIYTYGAGLTAAAYNADTDGKICIGTAAAPQEPLIIKNRLGSEQKISLVCYYN